jgi:metal-dependent amidase/aminoacylase/carboxypeptidase family protein
MAEQNMTVRSENPQTRKLLPDGIRRVAINTARAAGVAEDRLPTVREADDPAPPTVNDIPLTRRLKAVWVQNMGPEILNAELPRLGMGAEDFPAFTTRPYIPTVYFRVGGTQKAALDAAGAGGPPVAGQHSGLFRITPEESVRTGVEASTLALLDLLKKP